MTGSSHNRRRLASVAARILGIAAGVLLLVGCGRDKTPEPAAQTPSSAGSGSGSAYTADIEKLCDVVARSGAGSAHPNDRMYLIATWLGTNIAAAETRAFLARIQPLEGEAKAQALEAEAARVGLAGCALAAEWRKPAP